MSKNYEGFGLSREALIERIRSMVKPTRFAHMLGVEQTAIELAERFGADPDAAGLAGLLHDYAKELKDDEFMTLIDKYHLDANLKSWGSEVLHGKVGWLKIREDLGLENAEVLRAIELHTVGAAEMSTLEKVVYLADYIEPGRDFPGVDKARELVNKSLDAAVAFETARTVEYLANKKLPIYPQTLETYNAYIKFLK